MENIIKEYMEDEELQAITSNTSDNTTYEVWAIGYDEENQLTGAELFLGTFEDPDLAIAHAKNFTIADVVHMTEDDDCDPEVTVHTISIEVETVVSCDESKMNVGTIYKNRLEVFEEFPEFISLTNSDFEILEDGNIQIPCTILKDYNKNDIITVVFADAEFCQPMTYKIMSKTTAGNYICEFV
jgi:hypothetical protein